MKSENLRFILEIIGYILDIGGVACLVLNGVLTSILAWSDFNAILFFVVGSVLFFIGIIFVRIMPKIEKSDVIEKADEDEFVF